MKKGVLAGAGGTGRPLLGGLLGAFAVALVLSSCACRSDRRAGRSEPPRPPVPREPSTPPGPLDPSARPRPPVGKVVLSRIRDADLCFTTGGAGRLATHRMMIGEAKMRAVARDSVGDAAELRFTYLGPTEEVVRLASGSLRRQLGLKLRAADGCNLVYVMWRLEPKAELVVSVKRNPGERTHRECGTNGYRNVRPRRAQAPPLLEPGAAHTLRADLVGDELLVRIDGQEVWQGALGQDVLSLAGPAGMRTDNVRLEAELLSQPAPAGRPAADDLVVCANGSD